MAPKELKDAQAKAAPKKRGRPAAEIVQEDPQSMRKSISRMLSTLNYKADPSKNKSVLPK